MYVIYSYCSNCGMEHTEMVYLAIVGQYANGLFLVCDVCKGSIGPGNYEVYEDNN